MKIIIVGGGTAGWSAAAAISNNPKIEVTIIEPKDIATIGVGESTLPLINQFHKNFEIFNDFEWIQNSSGILKFTIDFENFTANKVQTWSHPFNINKSLETQNVLENAHRSNQEITDQFFYTQRIRNEGFHELSEDLAKVGAYHLDAKLYANELKDLSLSRGVKLYENKVIELNQTQNYTNFLILDNGEKISGDAYLDCTGFKNILFKNLHSQFISFQERLFCDAAVTVRLPFSNQKKQQINSTLCYALQNGWVWHTPLQNSITMGYVYSSAHCSQSQAQEELLVFLKTYHGYSKSDYSFKHLKFRTGTYQDTWLGNNISIGLSSFFLEPIESTGIALFQIQITELCKVLQNNPKFFQNYQTIYNKSIREKILSVKEFVEMHYILSNRDDSKFWKDASNIMPSQKQKLIMQLYNQKEYKKILSYSIGEIFSPLSWLLLLIGMDKTKTYTSQKDRL